MVSFRCPCQTIQKGYLSPQDKNKKNTNQFQPSPPQTNTSPRRQTKYNNASFIFFPPNKKLTTNRKQFSFRLPGSGLWDQGVCPHFCDTRESPPLYRGLVFGRPFLLYHRSGHFTQPWPGWFYRPPRCGISRRLASALDFGLAGFPSAVFVCLCVCVFVWFVGLFWLFWCVIVCLVLCVV